MAKDHFAQNRASARPGLDAEASRSVEGLADFLRRKHRFDVAYEAGKRLNVPAKTVRNWLDGICAPGNANVRRIAMAYGPDALAAMFPERVPDFLKSACREQRRAQLIADRARIEAELRSLEGFQEPMAPGGKPGATFPEPSDGTATTDPGAADHGHHP